MRRDWQARSAWFGTVNDADLRKVLARIRRHGALTIRDIDDDILVDKEHAWASRKPSKRALRAQAVVSLDSVCYLDAARKPAIRRLIERRVRHRQLVQVSVHGAPHWLRPESLEAELAGSDTVHILSPFDPMVHQRRRLRLFFDYEHRFEAYVPKDRRRFGYFAQPVLVGDEIAAVLDLKTDRVARRLLIQQWTWIAQAGRREKKRRIEEALHRFERFQLGEARDL
jgi:uncharacterized protein YcaQ